MSFWNEAFYFEKRGDRYVYRPMVFSAGFDISESEKNQLFRGLNRLQWRCLFEGMVIIGLIFGLFATAVIDSQTPILWFMLLSVVALAALAVTVLFRRDRLIVRILGHRNPEVPRLPFGQALATPRPPVNKRFAIRIFQSVIVLLGLAMAIADAFVLYVIVVAYRSHQLAEGGEETAAVEKFVSLTLSDAGFWVLVALVNAVLLAGIVFAIRQVRRLRAGPDTE